MAAGALKGSAASLFACSTTSGKSNGAIALAPACPTESIAESIRTGKSHRRETGPRRGSPDDVAPGRQVMRRDGFGNSCSDLDENWVRKHGSVDSCRCWVPVNFLMA